MIEVDTHQVSCQISSNSECPNTELKTKIMISDDRKTGTFQSDETHIHVQFSNKDEDKKGEVNFIAKYNLD